MPEITGRLEITLSVRDPARSADWYGQLLGMRQTYDHTSDDGTMRYICLVESRTEFVLCLVGHAENRGEEFSEFRTGLDHLEFVVARRELAGVGRPTRRNGSRTFGCQGARLHANAMLTFRDPDNIQLAFFWRAPPAPGAART